MKNNDHKIAKIMKTRKISLNSEHHPALLICSQINLDHPLVALKDKIDWEGLEAQFKPIFAHEDSYSLRSCKLPVALIFLQITSGFQDEVFADSWIVNMYWQYFCGYEFIQTKFPFDPPILTTWRERLSDEQVEYLASLGGPIGFKNKSHLLTLNRSKEGEPKSEQGEILFRSGGLRG